MTGALYRSAILAGLAFAAAAGARGPAPTATDARCTVVRILEDGRQVPAVMPPGLSGEASVSRRRGSIVARSSSRASGRTSVTSSSSSSSVSSSGGGSFARSTSSHTDEAGRTITITRDERGCRVTVDERTTGED